MSVRTKTKGPVLLVILDGFGEGPHTDDNAIWQAKPEFYFKLRETGLRTTIQASSEFVGLPAGQMGNSEVGHLTIGAGRTIYQDITRIDRSIERDEFEKIDALVEAIDRVRSRGTHLHLIGLVSDGGVHSSDRHYRELVRVAHEAGIANRTVLHALLDGRDTPPRSAAAFVEPLEHEMNALGSRIATVGGRYWGMDRDRRWDRVKRAWDAIVLGRGETAQTALGAVRNGYARDENDEFVAPTVVAGGCPVADGDVVLIFNFRADRVRQLTEALLFEAFSEFDRERWPRVHVTTMTRYRDDFACPVLFPPTELHDSWPDLVSRAGMSQLRIAETEKYAHVTFFFGGGREDVYPGERRILVPSPKVATYDLQPAMSAVEVTDRLIQAIETEPFDLGVLNLANGDMVGHTGKLDAAVEAVRTLDACLARIVPAITERGGVVALTADHGNCEKMWDETTDSPNTAHTTYPVHFLLTGDPVRGLHRLAEGGTLADIAPTLLPFLGIETPRAMDGRNLAS